MHRFLVVAFLVLLPSISPAFEAGNELRDENLLYLALENIDKMSRPDIDRLAPVLSSCGSLLPLDEGAGRYECNKELIQYQLSANRAKAVSRLLAASYSVSRLLRLKGSEQRLPEWDELLRRQTEVYDTLIAGASIRAMELSTAPARSGK